MPFESKPIVEMINNVEYWKAEYVVSNFIPKQKIRDWLSEILYKSKMDNGDQTDYFTGELEIKLAELRRRI